MIHGLGVISNSLRFKWLKMLNVKRSSDEKALKGNEEAVKDNEEALKYT